MKYWLFILSFLFVLFACNEERPVSSVDSENWEKRSVVLSDKDSLLTGTTYLPVYSEIYSFSEAQTTFLTVTVSMRNVNTSAIVYITKADYFDTHGKLIRSYFKKPISLNSLETVEIIIDEADNLGGVGGNFVFEWAIESPEVNDPFFEAVMISTKGQQGLSFTTNGIKLKN